MNRTTRRRSIAVSIALVVSAGLVGCTGTSAPDAQVSPSASTPATATASTPAPSPVVTTVLLRPEHLELVDVMGAVVTELSYDSPTSELIGALTAAFGEPPELDEHPVGYETPQRDIYRWGGFEIWDDLMGHVEGDDPSTWTWIPDDVPDTHDMNVTAVVYASSVGEVDIATVDDDQAGDDIEAIAQSRGREHDGFGSLSVETGPELGPRQRADSPNAYSVVFQPWEGATTSRLIAPINLGVEGV
jgi:hypothetical protein